MDLIHVQLPLNSSIQQAHNNMAHAKWLGLVVNPSLLYGRGTIDILWGCFFTSFICTWTVQHPPVPARGKRWYWISLRKMRLMVGTLLAPEFLVGTSISDHFEAKK
jgi:hypothetical protein